MTICVELSHVGGKSLPCQGRTYMETGLKLTEQSGYAKSGAVHLLKYELGGGKLSITNNNHQTI